MINTLLRYNHFGPPESALEYLGESLSPLAEDHLRVRMRFAPVNASDLIPITGAYGHRVIPPQVAGYEGVGIVTEAPAEYAYLLGMRVLPLRGRGTWQKYVDCPAELAVPVPDDISDAYAARAYINPLAATLMLKHFSPMGKQVLVTAAGSECAQLIGQWALKIGAHKVMSVYRSPAHADKLARLGMMPVSESEIDVIRRYAKTADVVYEAVGGELANILLSCLPETAQFVSYGLLSGQPFSMQNRAATLHWFHVRNYLATMSTPAWQAEFKVIWALLRQMTLSDVTLFPLEQWQAAIAHYKTAGRTGKPMLDFTAR